MKETVFVVAFIFTFSFVTCSTECDPCSFNHSYSNTVDGSLEPFRYKFQINDSSQVVRVRVQSLNASTSAPVIVVVRETRAVLSWQVPLRISNRYPYDTVSRTLCPVNETSYQSASISVEISSAMSAPVQYSVTANLVKDFYIELNERHSVTTTPSEPQYLAFVMPDDVNSVVVRMISSDSTCMYFSVQDIQCPVFDLDTNVLFTGIYQTVSTKGSLSVSRSKFKQFYIVFVMKADDVSCYPDRMETIGPSGMTKNRVKTFEVWVEPMISETDYIFAIAVTGGIFAVIYLLAFSFTLFIDIRETSNPSMCEKRKEILAQLNTERSPLRPPLATATLYGALDCSVSENLSSADFVGTSCYRDAAPKSQQQQQASSKTSEENEESSQGLLSDNVEEPQVEEEYDSLPDAVVDKRIIRSKPRLCVADLARKPHKLIGKKYTMYFWNLCTIAIFYTLPVIQLVLTYQTVVLVTGNEDLCFYNFDCARPLGSVFAFNSLFSNVGYVLLGFLFLILVRKRDRDHQRRAAECEVLENRFGVPRHFGLFYSMGAALSMEGVLSGCYHICPNYTNFQFDTAFMYMIAALGMLKIYQIRHPDINAHSHVAYAVMALVILLAVVGVVYNSLPFWIIFSICFILLEFMLSAEFYFKSEWKLDRAVFHRIHMEWLSSRGCSFFKPSYPDRMIYLLFCNLVNITFVVLGVLKQPKDFPSFLLTIFISNLLLYLMFYIVMKLRHREKLYIRVVLFIILACFSWAAGLFFFSQNRASWMLTPAESRQLNGKCILFNFYDSHDVWHFLSALSLFLSFMVVLVIDDDLVYKSQEIIPVF